MVIWVKAGAVHDNPNNQRYKVVEATRERIIVESCGTEKVGVIKPSDIVGVELSAQLDIMFTITGLKSSSPASPYPCCRN